MGKHIYNTSTGSISDMHGNTIQVSSILSRVKAENIRLYLTALFDSINQARDEFLIDCEEDTGSDIIWTEE